MAEEIIVDEKYQMNAKDEAPEPNKDTEFKDRPVSSIDAFKEAGIPCE